MNITEIANCVAQYVLIASGLLAVGSIVAEILADMVWKRRISATPILLVVGGVAAGAGLPLLIALLASGGHWQTIAIVGALMISPWLFASSGEMASRSKRRGKAPAVELSK